MIAHRFAVLVLGLAACGSSTPRYYSPPPTRYDPPLRTYPPVTEHRSTCMAVTSDGRRVFLDDATYDQCRDFINTIEG